MLLRSAVTAALLLLTIQSNSQGVVSLFTSPQGCSPDAVHRPGHLRVSEGVIARLLLTHTDPVYPPNIVRWKTGDSVVLRATIGKDGMVEHLTPISGRKVLFKPAMDTVSHWTYRPFIINNCYPVEVDTMITVNFNLNDAH